MTAPAPPRRPVTDDEVDTFWADGVVCLRGVLPVELGEALAEPVERSLEAPETADLTEMVLLGNVALRAGQPIDWDAQLGLCRNLPSATRFIHKNYRAF